MLLPDSFVFNIYKMSSWSRGIVVPLSVIWASKPSCPVPDFAAIPELHIRHKKAPHVPRSRKERYWRAFFVKIDHAFKRLEAAGMTPLRKKALAACEQWIHERLVQSDGLGAIFPPIINTIIAFRCLGYAMDDPRLQQQVQELETARARGRGNAPHPALLLPDLGHGARRWRRSPTAGTPADDPAMLQGGALAARQEVKTIGDWKKACPEAEPGGWYFEYANEWYPDTDDTAEVLTALSRAKFPGEADDLARQGAIARGQAWLLAMQNKDGGWGAFDKDCDNEVLTYIPFADHNAMIDPSCEDITGRALEAFHAIGVPADHPAVRRAAEFVESKQYPTTAPGTAAGAATTSTARSSRCGDCSTPARTCASRASRGRPRGSASCQNADGGWGELPHSYDDPSTKGQGPSTPSQTAWALMALFATGDRDSDSRAPRASSTCSRTSSTTAPGRTSTGRRPGSRRSSTCATISTRPTSRSGRWRSTRARERPECPAEPSTARPSTPRRRNDHGVN